MSRLKLAGLTKEKDIILNALASTGLAEIKSTELLPDTEFTEQPEKKANTEKKLSELAECIEFVSTYSERYAKEHKVKESAGGEIEMEFNSFANAGKDEERVLSVAARVKAVNDKIFSARNSITQCETTLRQVEPYLNVKEKFCQFADTKLAKIYFGAIPSDKIKEFKAIFDGEEAVDYEEWESNGDFTAVLVAAHRDVSENVLPTLNSIGFQRCPFAGETTSEKIKQYNEKEIKSLEKEIDEAEKELFSFKDELGSMKILADYYSFELEKINAMEKAPGTATSFVLEAYVPKDGQKKVAETLDGCTDYVCYEFFDVDKDEMPPTLMKNNKVVKNFEFVTNMYSAPNYREQDPNPIMSIFFSIFLGFIMGDAGYGLIMAIGGFIYAARIKRDTGMKRLANVIGIGGLFAIVFGVMFGSYFGFSPVPSDSNPFTIPFLPNPIMPDAQKDLSSLAGITVPSVLLIALGMGIVQLMASNAFKAYSEFKLGHVADGLFFGVVWVFFLGGMGVMILGLVSELNMSYLAVPGAIVACASLFIAAVTAGIHEKGIGKFTKGFGAVYGIINYLSDILSYARLYGLMLSGAVIAQIVSGQGMLLLTNGNPIFAVLGVVVIIIGHVFNLAMNVLGAYIHDARLQYIEFFSRFYTGDGELFAPLGSKRKYVYLK
ncbi:MAG: V-type ATP synthase subunit I [bacterium]|nr:V-type ATP synthase subunit I [bacterium]